MTSPVVRVSGLHKSFGDLEVLKGIDMDINSGEVVVVFGRSGSGKSTFLRCINFLEEPTQGEIDGVWSAVADELKDAFDAAKQGVAGYERTELVFVDE